MFQLNCVNKLCEVDVFDSETVYMTKYNGYVGCNATKIMPVF